MVSALLFVTTKLETRIKTEAKVGRNVNYDNFPGEKGESRSESFEVEKRKKVWFQLSLLNNVGVDKFP